MVWLATRYRWSKRSDHVLQSTIAHGRRPAVNISDKLDNKINLYGKKTPPQIRISRAFAIRLYRMLGSFYRPNPNPVFITITPSRVTSPKDNQSKISTSQETYPVNLLPHREESSQLCVQPINISISNCLYPFWAWNEIFTVVCFVGIGWFSIRILDNFRFSPIFELSVQTAYPMRILEENICFVEMGWLPNQILVKLRFSPDFELSVQLAYPIIILEEDKAIGVRSGIIRTRLGC